MSVTLVPPPATGRLLPVTAVCLFAVPQCQAYQHLVCLCMCVAMAVAMQYVCTCLLLALLGYYLALPNCLYFVL